MLLGQADHASERHTLVRLDFYHWSLYQISGESKDIFHQWVFSRTDHGNDFHCQFYYEWVVICYQLPLWF